MRDPTLEPPNLTYLSLSLPPLAILPTNSALPDVADLRYVLGNQGGENPCLLHLVDNPGCIVGVRVGANLARLTIERIEEA